MSLPSSWAEAVGRLAHILGDEHDAAEWARQAVESVWHADVADLDRQHRALALQRLSGVVLALEDTEHDLVFDRDERVIVAAVFARYFRVDVDGPEWRIQPHEDRPSREDLSDDFGEPVTGAQLLRSALERIEGRRVQRAKKKVPLPLAGLGPEDV